MAVVSRVATLVFTGAAGSRTWQATAAVQDTAAGSSVVITTTAVSSGVTPPVTETALTLNLYTDTGALVRAFTLTVGSASQTSTFFFTADGTSTGAPAPGTFEVALRAAQTGGLAATQYDYETDGSPSTLPTGFTATQVDRGWIRGTTTSSTVLAGAGTLAYGDTLTATTTLGAAPLNSKTLSVALAPVAATASAASTTVTFTTALGTVDNRFPASSASRTTAVTVPTSALSGAAWTTLGTPTEATVTVDPRISVSHYMTLDDVTFRTPPDSPNDSTHGVTSRLTSQEGDVIHRLTNANAVGLNGITFARSLKNHANAAQVGYNDTGLVTVTKGGALGWSPSFGAWASQLSGGAWDDLVTITAPSSATGLESGATATLTLLATDSRIGILVAVTPDAAIEGRHLQPGDAIKVALSVYNRDTHTRLAPDAAPTIILIRHHMTLGWMYLAADGATWTDWGTGAADSFATTAGVDVLSYAKVFADTASWTGTYLMAVGASFTVNGTPYGFYVYRELSGANHPHDTPEAAAVTPGDIALIANAVWDEPTAEARPAGSFGQLVKTDLDATVSSRATPADVIVPDQYGGALGG